QRLVVVAMDDGAVAVAVARRRNDHLPCARLQVRARPGLAGEQPRAFEHHVDAELLPRQLRGIALRHHANALVVDHHALPVHAHAAREAGMRGVVLQQVGVGPGVAQVVDRHELQAVLLAALVVRPQYHSPDPSEAVDRHLDSHFKMLLTALATFSGVKPKNLKRSPAGADSPKRSMPTTAPSRPTYFLQ